MRFSTGSAVRALRRVRSDARGSGVVEYMILVGVVALLSLPAFMQFGSDASKTLRDQGVLVNDLLPRMGF